MRAKTHQAIASSPCSPRSRSTTAKSASKGAMASLRASSWRMEKSWEWVAPLVCKERRQANAAPGVLKCRGEQRAAKRAELGLGGALGLQSIKAGGRSTKSQHTHGWAAGEAAGNQGQSGPLHMQLAKHTSAHAPCMPPLPTFARMRAASCTAAVAASTASWARPLKMGGSSALQYGVQLGVC